MAGDLKPPDKGKRFPVRPNQSIKLLRSIVSNSFVNLKTFLWLQGGPTILEIVAFDYLPTEVSN